MDKYYILTFENTHGAINGERILKDNNVSVIVMPTPTFITKSCGISLRISEEEIEKVKQLISEGNMKTKEIILKEGVTFKQIKLI